MKKIQVEMISDVICPWCWIGKRNLERAIAIGSEQYEVTVKWSPYLLRPDTPKEGSVKDPDTPSNPRVGHNLRQAGRDAGINFTGKCDRTPNTVMPHNLLRFAGLYGGDKVQNRVQESLFNAYFTDGETLGIDLLTKIAGEVGLDSDKARTYIESQEADEATISEAMKNSRSGVQNIPFCIVNGKAMIVGAQPPNRFLVAFAEAPEL